MSKSAFCEIFSSQATKDLLGGACRWPLHLSAGAIALGTDADIEQRPWLDFSDAGRVQNVARVGLIPPSWFCVYWVSRQRLMRWRTKRTDGDHDLIPRADIQNRQYQRLPDPCFRVRVSVIAAADCMSVRNPKARWQSTMPADLPR